MPPRIGDQILGLNAKMLNTDKSLVVATHYFRSLLHSSERQEVYQLLDTLAVRSGCSF